MRRTHNLAKVLPFGDPLRLANNVYDEAAAGATDLDELDQIDIDSIVLSSHGLDPALPWKEYGFLDGNDAHRDRIPTPLLQEMDNQSVSLPHQSRERHCPHWQPSRPLLFSLYPDSNHPSILRLHLRADSSPQVKSDCADFPSSLQSFASQGPFPVNGAEDDEDEELDLDPPGEQIPEYAKEDL
eukprot:910376-Rhodomonas_salina.2